jgi:hypothetical protein
MVQTKSLFVYFSMLLLSACAATTVTPVARNQIILSTSAAPVCGVSGAQLVASRMAAVETIRHGFSRFVINGMQAQNNVQVIERPFTGAYTTSTYSGYGNSIYGRSQTQFTGGGVMYVGSNDSELFVTMLNPGDPGYSDGVDAQSTLGPKWEKLVHDGISTCTG